MQAKYKILLYTGSLAMLTRCSCFEDHASAKPLALKSIAKPLALKSILKKPKLVTPTKEPLQVASEKLIIDPRLEKAVSIRDFEALQSLIDNEHLNPNIMVPEGTRKIPLLHWVMKMIPKYELKRRPSNTVQEKIVWNDKAFNLLRAMIKKEALDVNAVTAVTRTRYYTPLTYLVDIILQYNFIDKKLANLLTSLLNHRKLAVEMHLTHGLRGQVLRAYNQVADQKSKQLLQEVFGTLFSPEPANKQPSQKRKVRFNV